MWVCLKMVEAPNMAISRDIINYLIIYIYTDDKPLSLGYIFQQMQTFQRQPLSPPISSGAKTQHPCRPAFIDGVVVSKGQSWDCSPRVDVQQIWGYIDPLVISLLYSKSPFFIGKSWNYMDHQAIPCSRYSYYQKLARHPTGGAF